MIYRKDTLLQRFLREALPPRGRVVAPRFEHETAPTVAHAAIPSVGRFRRRCHRPTIVRAPQGREGCPHLLRGLVMARQTEWGARPHSVPVPHPVVPLALIRACRNTSLPSLITIKNLGKFLLSLSFLSIVFYPSILSTSYYWFQRDSNISMDETKGIQSLFILPFLEEKSLETISESFQIFRVFNLNTLFRGGSDPLSGLTRAHTFGERWNLHTRLGRDTPVHIRTTVLEITFRQRSRMWRIPALGNKPHCFCQNVTVFQNAVSHAVGRERRKLELSILSDEAWVHSSFVENVNS